MARPRRMTDEQEDAALAWWNSARTLRDKALEMKIHRKALAAGIARAKRRAIERRRANWRQMGLYRS